MKHKVSLILILFLVFIACNKEKKLTNSNPPFSFTSSHSDCKEEEGFGKITEIWGPGKIIVSSFNDTIRVMHANAHYNCCSKIEMSVKRTQVGFDLCEKDYGDSCNCMCYIDVTAFIFGIKSGTYLVRVLDTSGNLIDQGYVIVQPTNDDGPRR